MANVILMNKHTAQHNHVIMVELTLDLIVSLAGDWADSSRASKQFREIIENEQTSTEEISAYLQEAINGTDDHHNRAIQDLVNNIGQRLGFRVDYGVYQGRSDTIGYDGHWVSAATETETHLIVETKKSTSFSIDLNQAGGYIDEFTDQRDISHEQVYGLYVIGEGNIETVAQTILGSQYREQMRVIRAEQLLNLLEIQQESTLRHEQVVDLLLPINAVNVGQLVGLVQDVIEFRDRDDGENGPNHNDNENNDEDESESGTNESDWGGPQVGANAIQGTTSRTELDGHDTATVAVFPSKTSGIGFLKENNAWGFVRISQDPEYAAIYISDDVQKVRYVARVQDIVPATEAQLAQTLESYTGDQAEFDETKKVVVFEPESLYELADPIEFETRVPYSLRYTELERFKQAKTTDDIL